MNSTTRARALLMSGALIATHGLSATAQAQGLPQQTAQAPLNLMRLSIDELSNMRINAVSRRAEPLSEAPAAVYVINQDEIRMADARTIPEMLRLAPNLSVQRADALAYAITARGFNSVESANKLLVMIDGRSLYSPLHSGVFWENTDYLLDDLARVEVVSGPGGTLWGANAVNGVISILTKPSRETQGFFVKAGAGNFDRGIGARYGGAISDELTYRVYVKAYEPGDSYTLAGVHADDSLTKYQGGFRADWQDTNDIVTVSGDIYDADSNVLDMKLSGGNILGRWSRTIGDQTMRVRAYFDRTTREPIGVFDRVDSYDIDAQYNLPLGQSHDVVFGGGYRHNTEEFFNGLNAFNLSRPKRTLQHANVYGQDTIALTDTLNLIAGIKLEWNHFTNLEVMPNARLAWHPAPETLLWAAASRAVRTPSRIDRELAALPILAPAPDFESEDLLAYEAGYRGQLSSRFAVSASVFYNEYKNIRTLGTAPGGVPPFKLQNGREGHTYGLETWGKFAAFDWWRIDFGVSTLEKRLKLKPGFADLTTQQHIGNDPEIQGQLRNVVAITPEVEAMVAFRYVDDLPNPVVPDYTEMDVRLAWHPNDDLEFSVSGHNLLHKRHPELGALPARREVPRTIYGTVRWTY